MLVIINSYGRLGNNIYQLLNIVNIANKEQKRVNIDNLKLKLNGIINLNNIVKEFENYNESSNINSDFMPKNLHLFNKRNINILDFFNISKKFIVPNLKININPLDIKTCCIHIRSGDIFSEEGHLNSNYIQPPLAYYKKIISDINDEYDKFIIISEKDKINPCIQGLLNYSSKIEFQSKSEYEDYEILMRTQTIILSRSSFSDSVVYLSPNIKNVYFWNYNHCFSNDLELPNRINFHPYKLTDEYIEMGNWKNNEEQLNLMKNYPLSKVYKQKCLIIFSTCKSFKGDDDWRQTQAILSWTKLEGIRKKIILIGNDYGINEICQKYNLIHWPEVKTLDNIPYVDSMFKIAYKFADNNDYLMWCNSDIIFFNDLIKNILEFEKLRFSNKIHFNNFILTGQRHDWHNPKEMNGFNKEEFIKNMNSKNIRTNNIEKMDSNLNECSLHLQCGIDYLIHSKSTLIDRFDKRLVIGGQRHDMLLFGVGIKNKFFTCDITDTNFVIHQNHGEFRKIKKKLNDNNKYCTGLQVGMETSLFKSVLQDNKIKFLYKIKYF
jgi:hypothetical protein